MDVYSNFIRLPKNIHSLRDWNQLLFEGSLGCIGHLEMWLRESLGLVIAKNSSVLREEHLLRRKKPKAEIDEIGKEILRGEEAISTGFEDLVNTENHIRKKGSKKKSKKPFQKNPRRYPLGGR